MSHGKRRAPRRRAVVLTGAAVAALAVVGLAVATFPRGGQQAGLGGAQSASDNHSLAPGSGSPSPGSAGA